MDIKSTTYNIIDEDNNRKKFIIKNDKDSYTIIFTDNQWVLFTEHINDNNYEHWTYGIEHKHEEEDYLFKILPPRGSDHGVIILHINDTVYKIGIDFQEINMLRSTIKKGIPKKTKLGFFGKERKR